MKKPIRIKKEALDEEAPYDNWIDDHIFVRLTLKPKKKKLALEWVGWPELNVVTSCTYTLAEARLLYAMLGCHIKELESR